MTILGFLKQTGIAPPIVTAWAFWHYFSMFQRKAGPKRTEFGLAKDALSPAFVSAGTIWLVELTFRLMAFEWFGGVHEANLYAANIALSSLLTAALAWIFWWTRGSNILIGGAKLQAHKLAIPAILKAYFRVLFMFFVILTFFYLILSFAGTSLDESKPPKGTGRHGLFLHPLFIGRLEVGFLWPITVLFGFGGTYFLLISFLTAREILSRLRAR